MEDDQGMLGNVQELVTGAVVLLIGYIIFTAKDSAFWKLFGTTTTALNSGANFLNNMLQSPLLSVLAIALLGITAFLAKPSFDRYMDERSMTEEEKKAREIRIKKQTLILERLEKEQTERLPGNHRTVQKFDGTMTEPVRAKIVEVRPVDWISFVKQLNGKDIKGIDIKELSTLNFFNIEFAAK